MIDVDQIDGLVRNTSAQCPNESNGNSFRLVFVGRAVPDKGLVEQVTACANLPNVHLHIVGPVDETFQHKLQLLARSRDGGTWLHFHGAVDNEEVCRQIIWSDIFLLPSLYEAFPNALLEAMTLAKPVIVSEVGAMPEMIDAYGNTPCGLCVTPGDSDSLKVILTQMLEAPEARHAMGERGRKRVELLYSTDAVIKRLVRLWGDAMSGRSNDP
jgi:glycosyltransferase involved in cell wall biosynthesis